MPSREHLLHTAAYEFPTNDEYVQHVHRLGNLVLLDGSINSACNNHAVEHRPIRRPMPAQS